jgi:DNA ligase-1
MEYKRLAEFYEEVSKTPKRLEKIDITSKFLKRIHKDDKEVLYLMLGDIYPEYDERKIGISHQLVIKALAKTTGIDSKKIVKEWKTIGDLGEVARKITATKKQSTLTQNNFLTTDKVLKNMRKLPELEGKGTVDKKMSLITELLISASPIEATYLIRTLIGDLRIGLKESTIRSSLASAFFDRTKEAEEAIQNAIDKSNDLAIVFEIVKEGDLKKLDKLSLEIGKPIKAMLAQKTNTIKEGFEALGKPCAIEYKYDGFRLIIHKKENQVYLFTRSLENVTKQFPEVIDYIKKYVKGKSFILDTEAVGFDKKTKEYKQFQDISQRIRRKYHIEKLREELPVEINVFDILYYNGKTLLDEPFEKRTALVKEIVEKQPYKIIYAKQIITDDEKKAEEFYNRALKEHQEGIMMKNLHSKYNPGSRVGHMLKMKPNERELDLVIVGGEYGAGKRSGWLSSFIVACYDNKNKEFLEIGKVGTGIKEKEGEGVSFEELTNKLLKLKISEKGKEIKVKPKVVVTLTYQEIQKSPTYESGFALRFPRVTALREDKPVSEINTLEEIKKDFEKQNKHQEWRFGC